MEWNVKNAVNVNVERQHLNKILKEIRGSVDEVNNRVDAAADGLGQVQSGLTTTITKVINNTLPAGELATQVTLTGDVTGQSVKVPGQNAVTINTTLSQSYVSEAPIDGNYYWRFQGTWALVPDAVVNLATLPDNGYVVITDGGVWQSRSIISADDDRIIVLNGDGNLDNTSIDLAEVVPTTGGSLLITEYDLYGRRVAEAAAVLSDLSDVNLTGIEDGDTLVWEAASSSWVVGEGGGRPILPVVTGEIVGGQPVFVYLDDGSLVYTEI